jgi:GTPase SAR1 family protein
MRAVWKHYYSSVGGIVFVVDSSVSLRLTEAREELHKVLSEKELNEMPLLIIANK